MEKKMIKTSKQVEENIINIQKKLNFGNTPKWEVLRVLINTSLSLSDNLFNIDFIVDGKDYRLEQITGFGKENDKTELYRKLLQIYHNDKNINNNKLEKYLTFHIEDGFQFLRIAIERKFDLFDFFKNEI